MTEPQDFHPSTVDVGAQRVAQIYADSTGVFDPVLAQAVAAC